MPLSLLLFTNLVKILSSSCARLEAHIISDSAAVYRVPHAFSEALASINKIFICEQRPGGSWEGDLDIVFDARHDKKPRQRRWQAQKRAAALMAIRSCHGARGRQGSPRFSSKKDATSHAS